MNERCAKCLDISSAAQGEQRLAAFHVGTDFGYLVVGRFVTVQKQYISRIRGGIHNLKCGKVAAIEVDDYVQSLESSVNYLRLFDTRRADKLQKQLRITLKTK
jgi:hypothetical protein